MHHASAVSRQPSVVSRMCDLHAVLLLLLLLLANQSAEPPSVLFVLCDTWESASSPPAGSFSEPHAILSNGTPPHPPTPPPPHPTVMNKP